ncbi:putative inner membrane transporter yiJE [Actinomadura rubteroloni]|uniref:Putative inner membrane transporter yiJE n=1 Tax=Actinomadura rubteroloni TaxID=1926885 RepID=A0A2P4UIT0_9ACTN|nr:EamA family transporter [Actinomadura rubteroloni]POM24931.1 putative inner membrane transporter yiJE [Actinomadura rubteroloni]
MRRPDARPKGAALVLAAAVLWGTVGPAQVWADTGADPVALGAARILVGGLILALVAARSRAGLSPLARRDVWPWLLLAALATAVYQAGFMFAVSRTGAALATAIALGTAPVATGALARLLGGDRPGPGWTAGTLGAVAGCALLLAPGAGRVDTAGIVLGIVSGACYGLYTVAAKRLTERRVPMSAAVSATLLAGGLAISPALAARPHALLDGPTLALLAWLGVAATAAAYLLFVAGLERVPASTAGTLSLAEPLVAAVLGLTVLGERMTAASGAGLALLLGGLAVAVTGGTLRSRVDVLSDDGSRI